MLQRVDAYRGAPIHAMLTELGLPLPEFGVSLVGVFRGGVSHTAAIRTTTWYAPFGLHHVSLLVNEDDTLLMAQIDD